MDLFAVLTLKVKGTYIDFGPAESAVFSHWPHEYETLHKSGKLEITTLKTWWGQNEF